jgi:hypothetical protein
MKIDYSKEATMEIHSDPEIRLDVEGGRVAVSTRPRLRNQPWKLVCVARKSRRGRVRHRALPRSLRLQLRAFLAMMNESPRALARHERSQRPYSFD